MIIMTKSNDKDKLSRGKDFFDYFTFNVDSARLLITERNRIHILTYFEIFISPILRPQIHLPRGGVKKSEFDIMF